MNQIRGLSSIIIIGLVILALALVSGGYVGYYLISKQFSKQTVCTKEVKVCPDGTSVGRTGSNCEFAACPEVKVDEIVNWKTYTDEKIGIEFKYPDVYQVLVDSGHSPLANPELETRITITPKDKVPDINNPSVDINLVNVNYFSSLDNYIYKTYGDLTLIGKLKTGESIYKYKMANYFFVFLANKNIIFDAGSESQDFLIKTVSTFKFINIPQTPSQTCIPNWTCGWGPCINGNQGQEAVDSNNCGLPSSSVNIACPALARLCQ